VEKVVNEQLDDNKNDGKLLVKQIVVVVPDLHQGFSGFPL
jgi:hypothetical protein